MAILDKEDQPSLQVDLSVPYAGKYVLVVEYHTPRQDEDTAGQQQLTSTPVTVEVNGQGNGLKVGRLQLEPCRFTNPCRQAVADDEGRVGRFDLESNTATLKFEVQHLLTHFVRFSNVIFFFVTKGYVILCTARAGFSLY
jgi:hypothetical protein